MNIDHYLNKIHRCCHIWGMKVVIQTVGVQNAGNVAPYNSVYGDMIRKGAMDEETWKNEWA
jgi:hypothetical protein